MAVLTTISRRVLRVWMLMALVVLVPAQAGQAAAASREVSEYHVKAAYLFHFTKFVMWNDASTAPLVIGIVGEDPFGKVLDVAVHGKTVGGRAIEVRRLRGAQDVNGCHILFVSASEHRRFAELVREVGAGVLTVGEVPQFCRDGGMVRFFLDGNRVRFQINTEAAESSGLKIHSQLMSLAAK